MFTGTSASAVLGSLFGQLQGEAVTSSAEVNPDMLLFGAASVGHRKRPTVTFAPYCWVLILAPLQLISEQL